MRTLLGWLVRTVYPKGQAAIMRRDTLSELLRDSYFDGWCDGQDNAHCQEDCCSGRAYQSADGSLRVYQAQYEVFGTTGPFRRPN